METPKKRFTMKEDKKDDCVSCGNETPYNEDEHVDRRFYYVEGAGQLCKDCWNKVYNEN